MYLLIWLKGVTADLPNTRGSIAAQETVVTTSDDPAVLGNIRLFDIGDAILNSVNQRGPRWCRW